jgi:hypothetical protein
MSPAPPEEHRTRFRRPLGVAVMGYKAVLGLSEIAVGVLLAVPSFDPQATYARLSAEELREDPATGWSPLAVATYRHYCTIAARSPSG